MKCLLLVLHPIPTEEGSGGCGYELAGVGGGRRPDVVISDVYLKDGYVFN